MKFEALRKDCKSNAKMDVGPIIIDIAKLFNIETYVQVGVSKEIGEALFNEIYPHVQNGAAVDTTPMKTIPEECVYRMPIEVFAEQWTLPIDMLFIDLAGSDRANNICYVFETLETFVRKYTGIVLVHDTYPIRKSLCSSGEAADAWSFIRYYEYAWERVTLPGPRTGLSIMRWAGPKHLHWLD